MIAAWFRHADDSGEKVERLSPKPPDLAETVDGRSLLDDLIEFFDRFIDAREDDLLTAGLWCIWTQRS